MLNSPAITEATIESGTLLLFAEWLTGFYDGAAHAIGTGPALPFPRGEIVFQETKSGQPSTGEVSIRCVWVRGGKARLNWELVDGKRQQKAKTPGQFMFWVRAARKESTKAHAAAQGAAQLLFAILENSASTYPLASKGIHKLRPVTPELISNGEGSPKGDLAYSLRLVNCGAILRYPVFSQPI